MNIQQENFVSRLQIINFNSTSMEIRTKVLYLKLGI